jgi:hypothetical protein
MTHGGARRGAGRPRGAANRFSEQARAEAAAEGITPLEYMLGVLRDETNELSVRMDAAKAAAPYMLDIAMPNDAGARLRSEIEASANVAPAGISA